MGEPQSPPSSGYPRQPWSNDALRYQVFGEKALTHEDRHGQTGNKNLYQY
jgi:hypothetical protein